MQGLALLGLYLVRLEEEQVQLRAAESTTGIAPAASIPHLRTKLVVRSHGGSVGGVGLHPVS